MRISDWSSDVCSSDLVLGQRRIDVLLRDMIPSKRLFASNPMAEAFGIEAVHHRLIARSLGLAERTHQRLVPFNARLRSEEHTSELQSLLRISSAVFCLNKKN